ncbi:DUF6717 family protein [Sodaliphilus sp.]|uniref:DUF6717 family protein n=1 Tax=Sodaliphilus sp. TaxID=2815818 RepID=UPI00388F3213
MKKITSYAKVASTFAKGILGARKKEYVLSFVYVPEDKLWYIDMPWEGDRYNLAMVAGSDKLLDRLSDEDSENRVTLEVLPREQQEEHPGYIECVQTAYELTKGSFYDVHGLEGFDRDIWICPVTLCVLGHYPKYIYIKPVKEGNK